MSNYFQSKYTAAQLEEKFDTVTNLDTTHYTKTEIDNKFDEARNSRFTPVNTLPDISEADPNTIYMIHNTGKKANNKFTEYYVSFQDGYTITDKTCEVVDNLPATGIENTYYLNTNDNKIYIYSDDDSQFNENNSLSFTIVSGDLPTVGASNILYLEEIEDSDPIEYTIKEYGSQRKWEIFGEDDIELTTTLSELTDTDIDDQNLENGQMLVYNEDDDIWENKTLLLGHGIQDEEGTSITRRGTLEIDAPLTVEDDSTNEVTKLGLDTSVQVDWTQFTLPDASISSQRPIIPVKYIYARWLRFDPTDRKSLVIKAGTNILLANGDYKPFLVDTSFDLSSDISTAGNNYYVFMNNDGIMHASINSTMNNCVMLGRFHTLCANAGTTLTMKAPASPSSGLAVGGTYLVKPYKQADDPDFYSFYNKQITAVSVNSKYDVITMIHPLVNYQAGDILPESVWCSTFKPDCLFDDAMVFDKGTGIAVDVYLQSGTGFNTRSAYGATHTVSREPYNHMGDMLSVGKRLLRDNEFTSMALGSNEGTNIAGSADPSGGPVGGHSDTDGRRMISAIGVEEACGYLWTWLQEVSSPGTGTTDNWDTATAVSDGQGSFGKEYWTPYVAKAGGCWVNGALAGSRARYWDNRRVSVTATSDGRGSTTVIYGII